MLIRSRLGVSADGYVATDDGIPTLAVMPSFEPELGELDRLELAVLPILLGSGVPLSPGPAPGQGARGSTPLRLLRSDRTFPDGSVELVYQPGPAALR